MSHLLLRPIIPTLNVPCSIERNVCIQLLPTCVPHTMIKFDQLEAEFLEELMVR